VHRIRGELGGEAAAEAYEREIRGVTLGLVLLGIGADGHTASLFPESPALREEQRLAMAVPAPDVERVTLTPPALRAASNVLFLVTGEDKVDAVRRALAEPPDTGVPASLIRSAGGRTAAIVDRAAGAGLDFS
jgi:6-phosphogluconolactonase